MKRLISIVLILFFCISLYASRLSPEGLLHLTTRYFDITYGNENVESASLLASLCDELYEETCTYLGTEPQEKKIPVAITGESEVQNAYSTLYPSARIFLYDIPFGRELSSSWGNTLLGVFGHELFHHVSTNLRNGFWKGLSSLFGDFYTPVYLNASSSVLEGSAVLFESRNGEGRLNNPIYQAKLLEAKAEGLFPVSYLDITGLRDTSPTGDLTYTFSGAFFSFVVERYGMESYRAFLSKCNNAFIPFVDFSLYFHQAFGVWPQDEWVAFTQSIPTPVCRQEVVSSYKKGDRILASDGVRLVSFDSRSGNVYLDGEWLFTDVDVESASLEGNTLLYTVRVAGVVTKTKLYSYDLHSGKRRSVETPESLVAATLMGKKVVTVTHTGQSEDLWVGEKCYRLPFQIHALTSYDDTHLCFIGQDSSIYLFDTVAERFQVFDTHALTPYALTVGPDGLIYFTYAEKGTLLRMGVLDLDGSLTAMDEDVLGGIKRIGWRDGEMVVERSYFAADELTSFHPEGLKSVTVSLSYTDIPYAERSKKPLLEGEKASLWPYLLKGTILPAVNVRMPLDPTDQSVAFGAFRVSTDLYTDFAAVYGIGYSLDDKQGIAVGEVSGYLKRLQMQWILSSQLSFNGSFWNRVYAQGTYGDLIVQNQGEWYGNRNKGRLKQTSLVGFDNRRLRDKGQLSWGGIALSATFKGLWATETDAHIYNIGASFSVAVPSLLPLASSSQYTYNFPLRYTLKLYDDAREVLSQNLSVVLFSKEIQRGTPYVHLFFRRFILSFSYTGTWKDSYQGDYPLFDIGAVFSRFDQLEEEHTFMLSATFDASLNNRALKVDEGNLGLHLIYRTGEDKPFSLGVSYRVLSF